MEVVDEQLNFQQKIRCSVFVRLTKERKRYNVRKRGDWDGYRKHRRRTIVAGLDYDA